MPDLRKGYLHSIKTEDRWDHAQGGNTAAIEVGYRAWELAETIRPKVEGFNGAEWGRLYADLSTLLP